jgi:hypothetical protein
MLNSPPVLGFESSRFKTSESAVTQFRDKAAPNTRFRKDNKSYLVHKVAKKKWKEPGSTPYEQEEQDLADNNELLRKQRVDRRVKQRIKNCKRELNILSPYQKDDRQNYSKIQQ